MNQPQRIIRERRQYNQWVASQTLEDYALRFTAQTRAQIVLSRWQHRARSDCLSRLRGDRRHAHTALRLPERRLGDRRVHGLMFLIGLPIAYYAARYGVDIDLLTRGAGFGYMGSTAHLADLRLVHVPAVRHRSQHHVGGAAHVVRHPAVRSRTSSARWSSSRSRSTASA